MQDLTAIQNGMQQTYPILENLAMTIPDHKQKIRRRPGKWCIHEQICHLADVQPMLLERLKQFAVRDSYTIEPFIPGNTVSDAHLMEMEVVAALSLFREVREQQLEFIADMPETYWEKQAQHPEYKQYTPLILLRHILMHDHFHMYRIEQLWLTEDTYL